MGGTSGSGDGSKPPVDDQIPIIETYRGVGIHCDQPPARVAVVKSAIDFVHTVKDPQKLEQIARDPGFPPEVRLHTAAKIEALFEMATENREQRPRINLDRVRASVAALDSLWWRSPDFYASDLDPTTHAVRREVRLPDPDFSKAPPTTDH
jgi:hypothetical protein